MRSYITTATAAALTLLSLHAYGAQAAVVFMYHHFGDERYPSTNVRLEQFDAHLAFLEDAGFEILPVEEILTRLMTNQALADKTAAITMDDAYLSVYTEAYPRLKQRNWPFTVFVSTDYIDNSFPNYMSWAQMREMQQFGATFGNHSSSHDALIERRPQETGTQWRQRVRQDIDHAQHRLQSELTRVIPFFAYPYGEYDLDLANIVADAGLTGFGQQSGAVSRYSDRRVLPRFPINEAYGDLTGFRTKALSVGLPIDAFTPQNPIIATPRPRLEVTLAEPLQRANQLSCYASGQGRLNIEWLDDDKRRFAVQATEDLPAGRSRYNCTAPTGAPGRYYWFSQLWINQR